MNSVILNLHKHIHEVSHMIPHKYKYSIYIQCMVIKRYKNQNTTSMFFITPLSNTIQYCKHTQDSKNCVAVMKNSQTYLPAGDAESVFLCWNAQSQSGH